MKLLIVEESIEKIETLRASINEDVLFYVYTDSSVIINDIMELPTLSSVTHIAFLFHDQTIPDFPFLKSSESTYFSQVFIEFIRGVNEITRSRLTIDLITCNINELHVINEIHQTMKDLKLMIRYSLDATGNMNEGGDWIMESHGVNVKDVYFNEKIHEWNVVLYNYNRALTAFIKSDDSVVIEHIEGNQIIDIKTKEFVRDRFASEPIYIATGLTFAVIVCSGGEVYGYGANYHGQLGSTNKDTFTDDVFQLNGITNISYADCGNDYTILVDNSNNKLILMGNNVYGLLDPDPSLKNAYHVYHQVEFLEFIPSFSTETVTHLSCGMSHFAVVANNEDLYVRGKNHSGQLGLGNYNDYLLDFTGESNPKYFMEKVTPSIASITKISHVSCGSVHTAITTQDSDNETYIYCTGEKKAFVSSETGNYTEFTKIVINKPDHTPYKLAYATCSREKTVYLTYNTIAPRDNPNNLLVVNGDAFVFSTMTDSVGGTKNLDVKSVYAGLYYIIVHDIDNKVYIQLDGSDTVFERTTDEYKQIVNAPQFELIIYHNVTNAIAFCSENHVYAIGKETNDALSNYTYELKNINKFSSINVNELSIVSCGSSLTDLRSLLNTAGDWYIHRDMYVKYIDDTYTISKQISEFIFETITSGQTIPPIQVSQIDDFYVILTKNYINIYEWDNKTSSITVIHSINSTKYIQIAVSSNHITLLSNDFNVSCIPLIDITTDNDKYLVGNNDEYTQYVIGEVPDLSNIVQIACGKEHTVCLDAKGDVYTFGMNTYNQLGIGYSKPYANPTKVDSLYGNPLYDKDGNFVSGYDTVVKQISAGDYHTTVLYQSGRFAVYGLGYVNDKGRPYVMNSYNIKYDVDPIRFLNDVNPYTTVSIQRENANVVTNDHAIAYIQDNTAFGTGIIDKGASVHDKAILNDISNDDICSIVPLHDSMLLITDKRNVIYGETNETIQSASADKKEQIAIYNDKDRFMSLDIYGNPTLYSNESIQDISSIIHEREVVEIHSHADNGYILSLKDGEKIYL